MPDGDRFMRKLKGTGRGWGIAYKLACNDSIYLPSQIMKACADNFRSFSDGALNGAVDVLANAFERENWSKKENLLSSSDVFLNLEREYQALNIRGDYDLVGILEKTVKSVFVANRNGSAAMTREKTAERLGESLALNIMDSRWMSRVRDGLMEKQSRSVPEQIKWEQNLRGQILPAARKMMNNSFKGKDIGKFRAPVIKRPKKSTSEILTQKMSVLMPS